MKAGWFWLLAVIVATPGYAASFDCTKASTADEKAICASAPLSSLDDLLGSAYAQLRASKGDDVKWRAEDFLKQRGQCGANMACIFDAYVATLRDYRSLGARIDLPPWLSSTAERLGALPVALHQCIDTQVKAVTPRLQGGDYDSGMGIEYVNGGYQVSYGREPALMSAKPGDLVSLCLVSVPKRCPPGDNRGRVYRGLNLRTHASWSLPDSEHRCGGA